MVGVIAPNAFAFFLLAVGLLKRARPATFTVRAPGEKKTKALGAKTPTMLPRAVCYVVYKRICYVYNRIIAALRGVMVSSGRTQAICAAPREEQSETLTAKSPLVLTRISWRIV